MTLAKENSKGITSTDNNFKDSPCHLKIFIHILLFRNSIESD